MLKYCLKKWYENKDVLETKLRSDESLNDCQYKYLVKLVVDCILNQGEDDTTGFVWDSERITEIDDGKYQGTLLYLIPVEDYCPAEYDYLMTYVNYGSCSGCDTLLSIQDYGEKRLTDSQVKGFMSLCKDILTNIIKPYNVGWRHNEEFSQV